MATAPRAKLEDMLVHIIAALFRVRSCSIAASPKHADFDNVEDTGCGTLNFGRVSYHVVDVPKIVHVFNCKNDLAAHRYPVLLVPRRALNTAYRLAQRAGIRQKISIFALEGFLLHRLLFQALEQGHTLFEAWKLLIVEYNRGVETAHVPLIDLKQADSNCLPRPRPRRTL
jgi:Domain of unknown function (DUF4928)